MRTDAAGYIAPDRIYLRAAFLQTTRLGLSTVRKFRRLGIDLPTLTIGQQVFVRGSDGIAWLEAVAQYQSNTAPTPRPHVASNGNGAQFEE